MLADPALPAQRLERELDRILVRLQALGPSRLQRTGREGVAPADLVRADLTWLADTTAGRAGEPRRPVPVLAVHALGDQLVVLVHDLQAAVTAAGAPDDELLAQAAAHLTTLRRSL